MSVANAQALNSVQTNFAAKPAATTAESTLASHFSAPQTLSLSGTQFTLSTNSPTIPQSGAFNWLVSVKPSRAAKTAQIRFEVRRDSGSLVYRRTRYLNDLNKKTGKKESPKSYVESFNRDLTGLSLYEGTYTIAVEVTVSNGTDRETASLYSYQYIYDDTQEPTKWACALHFTSIPLRNAKGIFVVDPSQGTPEAQRQALARIVVLASTNSNARITLFISPLLLEDFGAIAKGYSLKLPNATQTQTVSANTLVPQRYAETLTALSNALAAGQLSLGIVGYSDPNLTKVSQAKMDSDIGLQYRRALSTLTPLVQQNAASLDASLTAPLGTRLSSKALKNLRDTHVDHVIVSDETVKSSRHQVGKIATHMVGFVSDSTLSKILTSQESTAVTDAFFSEHQNPTKSNLIITESVIANEKDALRLANNLELLNAQPWLAPTSFKTLSSAKNSTRIALKEPLTSEPTAREKSIYQTRMACEGLVFALTEDVIAIKAREDSLISEFGSPFVSAQKALANDLRSDYAQEAQHTVDEVFKKVTVKVASVTLSGREGKVPITIKNGNKDEIRILLSYNTSRGMSLDAKKHQFITLPPHETFLEPTVSMFNTSRGKLSITLTAADYTICEKTVKISASYIDTIVIVVIVVVIGIVLLLFIYRRVTSSDSEVNLFSHEDIDGAPRKKATDADNAPTPEDPAD